jgi:DNA-binding NtrC family response regulator
MFSSKPRTPPAISASVDREPYKVAVRRFKNEYLQNVLKDANGNVSAAAQLAKVNRQWFHQQIKNGYVAPIYRRRLRGKWGSLAGEPRKH